MLLHWHGVAGNCVLKFPGPGKSWKMRLVLEIYVQGPGKSWSLLCGDADGGRNDADTDAKICASAHLSSVFEQFFWYFFATFDTHTRLTAPFPGLPRWAGTRKVKLIWILLKQETVSGSGISWAICKSAPRSRQITTPAPHHSVFLQTGCPSCRPTNSVKALKGIWQWWAYTPLWMLLYIVSNCCLSLYLNISGCLRVGPGKMLLGPWKVLEFLYPREW